MTDEQYLRAIVENDCYASFEALMVRYRRHVYAVCLRQLRNNADAEDATQEVFRKLLEHSAGINGNLVGWLNRCARNTSISMIRSNHARRKREALVVTHTEQINHAIDKIDHTELVSKMVRELEPNQREMLIRHVLHGVSQSDLAHEQGVTQQAVAARLDRIRKQLRAWSREHRVLGWALGWFVTGWWSSAKASATRGLSSLTGATGSGATTGTAGTLSTATATKGAATVAVALSVACILPGDDPLHTNHAKNQQQNVAYTDDAQTPHQPSAVKNNTPTDESAVGYAPTLTMSTGKGRTFNPMPKSIEPTDPPSYPQADITPLTQTFLTDQSQHAPTVGTTTPTPQTAGYLPVQFDNAQPTLALAPEDRPAESLSADPMEPAQTTRPINDQAVHAGGAPDHPPMRADAMKPGAEDAAHPGKTPEDRPPFYFAQRLHLDGGDAAHPASSASLPNQWPTIHDHHPLTDSLALAGVGDNHLIFDRLGLVAPRLPDQLDGSQPLPDRFNPFDSRAWLSPSDNPDGLSMLPAITQVDTSHAQLTQLADGPLGEPLAETHQLPTDMPHESLTQASPITEPPMPSPIQDRSDGLPLPIASLASGWLPDAGTSKEVNIPNVLEHWSNAGFAPTDPPPDPTPGLAQPVSAEFTSMAYEPPAIQRAVRVVLPEPTMLGLLGLAAPPLLLRRSRPTT